MDNLLFWKYWKVASERRFYVGTLAVFATVLILYFVSYIVGNDFIMEWEKSSETKAQPTVIDSFEKNLFEFQFIADSYLIVENLKAGSMELNITAAHIYLVFLLFGLTLLFTAATFLSRTWYMVIGALVILHLATLNTELLYLFGSDQKIFLIVAFLAYMPLSYYFNAYTNEKMAKATPPWQTSFLYRFLIFAFITLGLAALVGFYSEVVRPEMFIIHYGIIVPLILMATFIGFNAYEVVNGFLYLVTSSANKSSKNTQTHFMILSGIYIANLFYAYLVSIKVLDFGILYINSFVLLIITLILGIWGFARRQSHYEGIMTFAPVGAFLYISLAIISLATIAYFFATGNDSLIDVADDVILYSHLSFGFSFFGYVLTNFYSYIRDNKKAYKIVYQPNTLDFIWVYALGAVMIFLMLTRTNYFTYRQTLAGYYNGLGDTYQAAEDMFLSEQYYKIAQGYEFQSHKANYSLGVMAKETGNDTDAYIYFDKATVKRISPLAYGQLADLLLQKERLIDAIFSLQEGVNRFPKSGELHLKLGMVYTNTKLTDSAYFYFDKAKTLLKDESGIAAANIYAILLKDRLLVAPDSVKKMLKLEDDLNTDNNELVLFNNNRIKVEKPINTSYLHDSLIFAGNLCYFYNYALNRTDSEDSMIWKKLDTYRKINANGEVMPFLDLAYILRKRKTGEYLSAFKVLDNLYKSLKDANPFYGNLAGLMMIEQDNYPKAINYLASATRLESKQAKRGAAQLNYAIALSEVPAQRLKAIETWQAILADKNADSTHQFIAADMLKLIVPDSIKNLSIRNLDDITKFRLAHYNQFQLSDIAFNDILKEIKDANYQLFTAIDRIHYYLDLGKPDFAEAIRSGLTGTTNVAAEVQQELIFADLKLLYKLKKYKEIGNLIESFKPQTARQGYKSFYKALYLADKNDSLQAEALFRKAIQQLPTNAEISMELAVYYNKNKQLKKAYNALVSGLDLYEDYHDYPSALYELYILQCLEMNYISFAEEAVVRLEEIVPQEEFAFFKKIFDAEMEKIKAQMENWE